MEVHNNQNNGDTTLHQHQQPGSLISQLDTYPSLGDGISQVSMSQTKPPLRYGYQQQQQQQYYQMNNSTNNMTTAGKLFVGQVPYIATEEMLRPLFESYGNIMEIKIMRDGDGRSKGCAWVRYDTQEQAQRAIEALHDKHTIPPQTNMLQVRFAQPSQGGGRGRGWVNRFSGYHGQPLQGPVGGYMGGPYGYNQSGYASGYHQGHTGGFGGRGGNSGWNNAQSNVYNQTVPGHGQQHGGYFAPPPHSNQPHTTYIQQQPANSLYLSNPYGGGGPSSHQASNQQLWT